MTTLNTEKNPGLWKELEDKLLSEVLQLSCHLTFLPVRCRRSLGNNVFLRRLQRALFSSPSPSPLPPRREIAAQQKRDDCSTDRWTHFEAFSRRRRREGGNRMNQFLLQVPFLSGLNREESFFGGAGVRNSFHMHFRPREVTRGIFGRSGGKFF